ncbi:MAG: PIN domain-containing protein [Bacteroidota bacterium]
MKIVIDSNIVFSAILNTKSKIGQLIINGSMFFTFYTVGLLKDEIFEHRSKILELTGFTENQFNEIYQLIADKIRFVDEILLTDEEISKASDLVSGIDNDDAMFVALNNHLLANLWTGDKQLINGLKKKGYSRLFTTDDLYQLYLLRQIKSRKKKK